MSLTRSRGMSGRRGAATIAMFVVAGLVVAGVAVSAPAVAAGYRGDEVLKLDLSKALLSPTPLGPPSQFEHVGVEAQDNAKITPPETQATTTPAAPAAKVETANETRSAARTRVAAKPEHAGRTRLRQVAVRRHGNPLDAQAFDTRIQAWPCRSGGICNWQSPR